MRKDKTNGENGRGGLYGKCLRCSAPVLLTENLGRLVEELLGGGALVAELLGHADGLSALTGEEESLLGGVIGRLHHRAGTGGAADGLSVFYWCDLCGGGRVSG